MYWLTTNETPPGVLTIGAAPCPPATATGTRTAPASSPAATAVRCMTFLLRRPLAARTDPTRSARFSFQARFRSHAEIPPRRRARRRVPGPPRPRLRPVAGTAAGRRRDVQQRRVPGLDQAGRRNDHRSEGGRQASVRHLGQEHLGL